MVDRQNIVKDIQMSLNNSVCEDAGIIPISIEVGIIEIGAMNPEFIRVKEVIKEIKKRFNVEVILKQITSSEWEEWFENNSSISPNDENTFQNEIEDNNEQILNKSILDESLTNSIKTIDNNENIEEDEERNYLNIPEFSQEKIDIQNKIQEKNKIESEEDSKNDKALIKLAQTNLGEDFENDADSFFGDEIT